jgi:hypothetical protein
MLTTAAVTLTTAILGDRPTGYIQSERELRPASGREPSPVLRGGLLQLQGVNARMEGGVDSNQR